MVSHHAALIYCMTLAAAADREMTDAELGTIGDIVRRLPVFRDYDPNLLPSTAAACADLVNAPDGLEKSLSLIKASLPDRLRETAYALACDIAAAGAAANGGMTQEVLRLLELLRHGLEIDRLAAAAIERGARAHYTIPPMK